VLLGSAAGVRAARPAAADIAELLDAYGLTCATSPDAVAGTRSTCDGPERNEFGMATLGAQYVVDDGGVVTVFGVETATDGLTPPTGTFLEFLVAAASLVCADDDPADLEAFIVANGEAVPQSGGGTGETVFFDGEGCRLAVSTAASGETENPSVNQLFLGIIPIEVAPTAEPVPSVAPTASPAATGSPSDPPASPTAPGTAGGAGDGGAGGDRPGVGGVAFANSVPSPAHVSTDPVVLGQSALLAALVILLMPFPGQLFNSTLETHEDEVRRWLRLDRWGGLGRAAGSFWQSPAGVVAFTLVAAALYALLDPGFGSDAGSIGVYVGMLLGIVVVTVAFSLPGWLAHGRGEAPAVRVVPISLLVGIACVAISRLTGFQPGYLYGLLIGLVFARELSRGEEARVVAGGAALMLGASLVAWLTLGWLGPDDASSIAGTAARTALAAVVVAALEGVTFGLLPFRFLPGEPLFAARRAVWAALLGVGAFAFFHVLINPASGYLADTSRTPLLTTIALLVGFGVVSVAFWAWFRFREPADRSEAAPEM
jgi:hypothetical protein